MKIQKKFFFFCGGGGGGVRMDVNEELKIPKKIGGGGDEGGVGGRGQVGGVDVNKELKFL